MNRFPLFIINKKLEIKAFDMNVPKVKNGEKSNIILIYGINGIGKTTFSECIRIQDNSNKYGIIKIELNEWKENNFYVYNKHFVNENVFSDNSVKDITNLCNIILGKKLIEESKNINDISNKVKEYKSFSDNSNAELKSNEMKLKECIEILTNKLGQDYLLKIDLGNNDILKKLEELNNKIPKDISEESYKKFNLYDNDILNIVDFDKIESAINYKLDFLTSEDEKKLFNFIDFIATGKQWYEIGLKALEHTNNVCPFCKQKIGNESEKIISKYKETIFDNSRKELELIIEDLYKELDKLENIILKNNSISDTIDNIDLKISIDIASKLKNNINNLKDYIHNKINNNQFTCYFKLENFKNIILEYDKDLNNKNNLISLYNDDITKKIHEREIALENKKNIEYEILCYQYLYTNREEVENLLSNKKELENYVNKYREEHKNYKKKYDDFSKELINMSDNYKKLAKEEIDKYANKINSILSHFLSNLRIESSLDINTKRTNKNTIGNITTQYKIIRNNKENVNGAFINYELSESEKNILGLSFFLAQLPDNEDDMKKSIVVFDDPMTSFDISKSSLLSKYICNKVHFKYIIVLTHNVEFATKLYYRKSGQLYCLELYEYDNRTRIRNSDDFIGVEKLIKEFMSLLKSKNEQNYGDMKNYERSILDIILSNAYLFTIDDHDKLKEYYRLISVGKSKETGEKFSFFKELKQNGILTELVDLYNDLSIELHSSNTSYVLSDCNEELPSLVNRGFDMIKKYFTLENI